MFSQTSITLMSKRPAQWFVSLLRLTQCVGNNLKNNIVNKAHIHVLLSFNSSTINAFAFEPEVLHHGLLLYDKVKYPMLL